MNRKNKYKQTDKKQGLKYREQTVTRGKVGGEKGEI